MVESNRIPALVLASMLWVSCGDSPSEPSTPVAPTPAATPTPVAMAPASPAPDPSPTPAPTPPPAGPTVLRTARIGGVNGHSASGTARIVAEGGSYRLELAGDFRIDSGNNDVYLTRSEAVDMARDLNLGDLKSTSGAQSYRMPNDGGAYRYVVLWCRPFRIPIAVGELR